MSEAKKYRKLPVVIEATQWFKNGDHPLDNCETFIASGDLGLAAGTPFKGEGNLVRYFRHPERPGDSACEHENCVATMHAHGWIDTLEGGHIVCPGDFIITGVKGEHYPCKPDIFALTYEIANTPPSNERQKLAQVVASIAEGFSGENTGNVLQRAANLLCDEGSDLAEMESRKDAAYLERNQLVAALSKLFPSGVVLPDDEGSEEFPSIFTKEWPCVFIDLPTGQASWHFHDSQMHLFEHLSPYEKPWDGHTTEEKYERVGALDAANIVCYSTSGLHP